MHTKRRGTRSQECAPGPMEHSPRRLQEQIPGVRRQQDMDGPSGCTNSSSQSHGINTRPSTGCDRQTQGSPIQIPGVPRQKQVGTRCHSRINEDRPAKMQSTSRIEQFAQHEAAASLRRSSQWMSRSPTNGVEWEQSHDDDYKRRLSAGTTMPSKQLQREHAKVVELM